MGKFLPPRPFVESGSFKYYVCSMWIGKEALGGYLVPWFSFIDRYISAMIFHLLLLHKIDSRS